MQQDESGLTRSIRTRKLTGPIKSATKYQIYTMTGSGDNSGGGNLKPDDEVVGEGLLEVPNITAQDKFSKHTEKEKIGTVYSVLSKVCDKLVEIDNTLHNEVAGLCTHMTTAQTQVDNNTLDISAVKKETETKIGKVEFDKLKDEVKNMDSKNRLLRGIVQKQHGQIKMLNSKIAYLTKKSMENNIIISGLEGDTGPKEKCKGNVKKFLKDKMSLHAEDADILVTHRSGFSGHGKDKKDRNMIVRCSIPLKERILKNAPKLKDCENPSGGAYYINKQLPDSFMEKNREIKQMIKDIKEEVDGLAPRDKLKIEVKKGEVFVNGQKTRKSHLLPVEPLDLFPEP